MTSPTLECRAERPGPYPALCRKPRGHDGYHYGHYGDRTYNWERPKTKVRRIAIEFPAHVFADGIDEALFAKVADAAHDWEETIPDRDWDVTVYATVTEVETP